MEDKSVLRWGGLAGMLGGIVFIFVPVILFGFVPPAPQGMFNQCDPSALILRSTGFIVLGVAMLRAPGFGKGVCGLALVLGALAFVGGFVLGVTSLLAALLVVPVFIILPSVLGWKLYSLSRSP